jgi:hypothetical protein
VASYRVAFDGKWQERFDDEADALEWAKAVGETGRMVYVVRRRWYLVKLLAIFPEDMVGEGKRLWRAAHYTPPTGGGGAS